MPEGFPKPQGISEAEQHDLDLVSEELHGPVVGAFVADHVSSGDHPQEIREAWREVRLPIRQFPNQGMKYGSEYLYVDAGEAYNALVVNGASESILRYWIDTLPSDPMALLAFLATDGEYEHFYPDDTRSSGNIPF